MQRENSRARVENVPTEVIANEFHECDVRVTANESLLGHYHSGSAAAAVAVSLYVAAISACTASSAASVE